MGVGCKNHTDAVAGLRALTDGLLKLPATPISAADRRWLESNAARNWNLVWRVSGSELLALWQRREPRSPSPRPSPQRKGRTIGRVVTNRDIQTARATSDKAPSPLGRGQARLPHIGRTRKLVARPAMLPLLWGEGWGEGERGRRTDAATQNVFGTRETEPQFLAALG